MKLILFFCSVCMLGSMACASNPPRAVTPTNDNNGPMAASDLTPPGEELVVVDRTPRRLSADTTPPVENLRPTPVTHGKLN
jgi:hypothetical protein